ncbi:proline dehydrogenase family protein [Micromonospora echinofusca]|uniref:proline dehydrogenase n=1 Tax=Micromonospora echinofusca TaxID=47858 RepID=A0ABS3VZR0_MICEH|nr:proline dehydrogenase family protein [Micromonospora echinofusca]MBO4210020.1 proline dehydrogenase [Micromonospora echinofusca]
MFTGDEPVTRRVVDRFVAGEHVPQALAVARRLVDEGLTVTIDHLGEDTSTRERADAVGAAYLTLLAALDAAGLAPRAEVSLKLSALGQALPDGGERYALRLARRICAAAQQAGTTVTLDMEDHTTVDSTLSVLRDLRVDFPWVGVALPACLFRTAADCVDLATTGSRVRLVKGAYAEPASVAYRSGAEVDAAFLRCLEVLMRGAGYPMVGSHDPALIAHADRLARLAGRSRDDYEYQMLYGVRTREQARLAAAGHRMRVYLPYGDDWYGYFLRRLAERPANLLFFLRSLLPESGRPRGDRTPPADRRA